MPSSKRRGSASAAVAVTNTARQLRLHTVAILVMPVAFLLLLITKTTTTTPPMSLLLQVDKKNIRGVVDDDTILQLSSSASLSKLSASADTNYIQVFSSMKITYGTRENKTLLHVSWTIHPTLPLEQIWCLGSYLWVSTNKMRPWKTEYYVPNIQNGDKVLRKCLW